MQYEIAMVVFFGKAQLFGISRVANRSLPIFGRQH